MACAKALAAEFVKHGIKPKVKKPWFAPKFKPAITVEAEIKTNSGFYDGIAVLEEEDFIPKLCHEMRVACFSDLGQKILLFKRIKLNGH